MLTARLATLAAVLVTTLGAAQRADAIVIAREGSEIVVRPDPGERVAQFEVVANADRDSLTVHNTYSADDPVDSHTGPGCDSAGSSCDVADATALRVELGAGDQTVLVSGSPIPVVVNAGPGNDRVTVRGGPAITVAGGDGDDVINLQAWTPPGGTQEGDTDEAVLNPPTRAALADGGPGDDELASVIAGARLTGGAGDDHIDAVTEVQRTETLAARTPTPQAIDCGAGADTAAVDHADSLGAGCGPTFTGLHGDNKLQNTLGWFGTDGMLNVPAFLRAATATTARLTVTGPRLGGRSTYASAAKHVAAGRAVTAKLKPAASVRAKLSRKTGSVAATTLQIALKSGADSTVVTLFGSLKPNSMHH